MLTGQQHTRHDPFRGVFGLRIGAIQLLWSELLIMWPFSQGALAHANQRTLFWHIYGRQHVINKLWWNQGASWQNSRSQPGCKFPSQVSLLPPWLRVPKMLFTTESSSFPHRADLRHTTRPADGPQGRGLDLVLFFKSTRLSLRGTMGTKIS